MQKTCYIRCHRVSRAVLRIVVAGLARRGIPRFLRLHSVYILRDLVHTFPVQKPILGLYRNATDLFSLYIAWLVTNAHDTCKTVLDIFVRTQWLPAVRL